MCICLHLDFFQYVYYACHLQLVEFVWKQICGIGTYLDFIICAGTNLPQLLRKDCALVPLLLLLLKVESIEQQQQDHLGAC